MNNQTRKELHKLETEANSQVPAVSGRLFDGKLFFEFMRKDSDLFIHIYKPVEAAIRKAESEIRARCPALFPLSEDPVQKRLQLYLQAEQERCDARRMAWRENVQWPDIGKLLEEAIKDKKFNVFDSRIEFVEEVDGWNIVFYKADIDEDKIDELIDSIVGKFAKLKVKWPREIFQ
jgi:hypothetical protein